MTDEQVPGWRRKRFKGNKVWAETDDHGRLKVKDHRVRIKYQIDQPHEYWVYPADLHALEQRPSESIPHPAEKARDTAPPPGTITIHTDGAASGNPGPAGIGIVLRYGEHRREISRYIGITTNNVAELEAVRTALISLKRKDRPVRIYTDSGYVHGLLAKGWDARANRELVASIRDLLTEFAEVTFIKVPGHQGVEENERADRLATDAIRSHRKT